LLAAVKARSSRSRRSASCGRCDRFSSRSGYQLLELPVPHGAQGTTAEDVAQHGAGLPDHVELRAVGQHDPLDDGEVAEHDEERRLRAEPVAGAEAEPVDQLRREAALAGGAGVALREDAPQLLLELRELRVGVGGEDLQERGDRLVGAPAAW
jgi:hypothetical protein